MNGSPDQNMLVSFPMYARKEVAESYDRFWNAVRSNLLEVGIQAPRDLTSVEDLLAHWMSPRLLISQTCGMPYRNHLHNCVSLIGTPDYGHEECRAGYYRSAIVVRAADSRPNLAAYSGALFAYNDMGSQSGISAPLNHAATHGVHFSRWVQSHAHTNSARMVASGEADIAAIDALSWKQINRYDSFAASLRVLDWTEPATPTLPFITSKTQNAELLYQALAQAIDSLSEIDQAVTSLRGLVKISEEEYRSVANPPVLPVETSQ
ncbi:MAG: PhnD/SsuA/transferrin family substrate-binding protein [Pseudomonadota bacterium]